jgi:hypothetical protein
MLKETNKVRWVVLSDEEYAWMQKIAKAERRSFSNWAAVTLRRALYEHPIGRANQRRWDA